MIQFEGVHLILGNDLAGDKVVVTAIVTEKVISKQNLQIQYRRELLVCNQHVL